MSAACKLCGRDPAAGFATIGDDRYCHGDDDAEPTCYMRGQGMLAAGSKFRREMEKLGLGVSIAVNGEPPIVIVEPPKEAKS